MATIKFGAEVTSIESSQNSFGKAPALSVDNSAGKFTGVETTGDTFSGTDPFISLSGDGSKVTVKVSNLQKDGAAVTKNAEVINPESKALVFWTESAAYGADDPDTLNSLIASASGDVAVRLNSDLSTTKAQAVKVPAGKKVTIDLNGHNLTSTGADAISNKGDLVVKGAGKVSSSAKSCAAIANFPDATATLNGGDYMSSSWYVIKNMGKMVIDGDVNVLGTDGNASSLIDNGWYSGTDTVSGEKVSVQADKASLHIISGEFDGKSGTRSCSIVKNDDAGSTVIDGGTFDSTNNIGEDITDITEVNAATIINWNKMTINGGTFKGLYTVCSGGYENAGLDVGTTTINGGDFTGAAQIGGVDSSVFGYNSGATAGFGGLEVNGGTFNTKALVDKVAAYYPIKISGGTFVDDVTPALADGATIKEENGKFVVTK